MKHLKVTLACNGGVSTSMLCTRLIAEGAARGYELECKAYAVAQVEAEIPNSDLVLVGPQVKYAAKQLQEKFPDKKIEVIDMRDYGTMNAAGILDKYLQKGEE